MFRIALLMILALCPLSLVIAVSSCSHQDEYIKPNPSLLTSRFMLSSDPRVQRVANVPLRPSWWSRPFEYGWAAKFAGPGHIVLDAACGVSHPFKWFLAEKCKETWVCDLDPRIMHKDQILQETRDDLGKEAYEVVKAKPSLFKNVHFMCTSICSLPDTYPKFDRIFCISTLEHMPAVDRKKALQEFARCLTPDGLIVLTVDYPEVSPETLLADAREVGLVPAGSVEVGNPGPGALNAAHLFIYRCILKKTQ